MGKNTKTIYSAFKMLKEKRADLFWHKALKKIGFKNLLLPLPRWLIIEPINICNLKCPICPTGSGKMTRPGRMMKFSTFKKIIDEVKGYSTKILLHNHGESFLNPEIMEMIRYASGQGIRVRISTNGTLIKTGDIAGEIIKSGLHYLTFSLDGLDQETFAQYRKGGNIEDVFKAIELMVNAKRALKSDAPKIELQFILTKNNEHQKEEFEKFAKKAGVDFYLLKSLHLFSEKEFQGLAKEYLPSDLSLSRYDFSETGDLVLRGKAKNFCNYVEESATILSDGSVVPCCYDFNARCVMGNVLTESLREIWHNKKYHLFRCQIKEDRGKIGICATCQEGREMFVGEKKSIKE